MNVQDAVNLVQQAVQYKRLGNYQASLANYLQAEKVLGNEPELYKGLGKVYYILGQYQKAVESYMKCVRLTGDADINMLMHMGHAICDPEASSLEEKAMAENYRCSIDPFFEQSGNRKYRQTRIGYDAEENYDRRCINTAASMFR
ncbi:tetratricopeptide repeat protein [Gorillibacterium timonense]|uniref:tetratricopeptide repeat protein n=1 Tax=Gorillibacterium timonense TaxID=1689269 RepID=UPI00071CB8E6|nr:tetratricopeptide repeat protein [Gorillibacterium timonense]